MHNISKRFQSQPPTTKAGSISFQFQIFQHISIPRISSFSAIQFDNMKAVLVLILSTLALASPVPGSTHSHVRIHDVPRASMETILKSSDVSTSLTRRGGISYDSNGAPYVDCSVITDDNGAACDWEVGGGQFGSDTVGM